MVSQTNNTENGLEVDCLVAEHNIKINMLAEKEDMREAVTDES